jgi:hypothetical protein
MNKGTFNLEQWMQMMIRFQENKKQGFPIIFFSYGHPMLMTKCVDNIFKLFFEVLKNHYEFTKYIKKLINF